MRGTFPARARRAVAVLLMAGAALLVAAPPASAHAQLEGSDPIPGEVRAVAPKEVTLTFSEPVERADGAIQMLDDHLGLVTTGPVTPLGGAGNRLSVSLPPTWPRAPTPSTGRSARQTPTPSPGRSASPSGPRAP